MESNNIPSNFQGQYDDILTKRPGLICQNDKSNETVTRYLPNLKRHGRQFKKKRPMAQASACALYNGKARADARAINYFVCT